MEAVPLRKLKAKMVMKDLSLREVAKLARVPYASASRILSGRMIDPDYQEQIEEVINAAPEPKS